MALKKSTLDVPAIGGLQQKLAPQRLPIGKGSAQAINLVANKAGRLEKRLGLYSLSQADKGTNTSFTFSKGLALSSWNDSDVLCAIGSGTWSTTGATVTALETYSDDLGGMVIRGPMPELKVVGDIVTANGSVNPAGPMSPVIAVSGDYVVQAWISATAGGPPVGTVYWQVKELSTGATVVAPTILKPGVGAGGFAENVTYLRLIALGSTFIVVFNDASHTIYAASMTVGTWTWGNGTTILITNNAHNGAFDARAVTGDANHFLLAYYESTNNNITVQQLSRGIGVVNTWSVTGTPNAPYAFGLRADSTTFNEIAVCWVNGNPYNVYGAVATYSTFTSIAVLGAIYTAGTVNESPPTWLDVAYGGQGALVGFIPSFMVSWSPQAACWNSATYTFQNPETGNTAAGLLSSVNPVVDKLFQFPDGNTYTSTNMRLYTTQYPENNARIIQCQFTYNGGWGNTSGGNAIITPGVTLASRGLEANGIVYYLGWIPSLTQGSFIALASDIAGDPLQNSTISGAQYPMRPVANLMTRQANANPGYGNELSNNLQPQLAPNYWTGGSEWVLSTDAYGTSYVGYMSSGGTQPLPAFGQIQTAPTTGFANATFGTLTAFSGGIPTLFDGSNVFEQSFLYAPEGIIASLSIATSVQGGGAASIWGDTSTKVCTLSDTTGNAFTPDMAGKSISISGADSGNTGPFIIQQVVNSFTVIFANPNAAAGGDSHNGAIGWTVTGPGNGPIWNSLTDSYSWIFTWEQPDSQGNTHQSARSLPVTISGYDIYYNAVSNTALGAIAIDSIANDGSSAHRVKITTHVPNNLQNGDTITITGAPTLVGPPNVNINGTWTVTIIDNTHFTLNESSFVGGTTSGGTVQSPRFLFPGAFHVTFYAPTLGITMRMSPTGNSNAFSSLAPAPIAPVSLVGYRTGVNGKEYYRAVSITNSLSGTSLTVTDGALDSSLTDGTHPLLYGDGSDGAPGSLDNFCPPATNIMVRHKERLFCAGVDDNLVMFTKQQGTQKGPGYQEQVDAFYVGGDDPVIGLESLDTNLVVLKDTQIYYVGGDGPADDGSGSFSPPQLIPTDSGCISGDSVKATPEGVYYQSNAGLRLVTRGLAVEYVGGPVEDELATYPIVLGAVLYPQNNRLLLLANTGDTGSRFTGELLIRDYVLDAWTTGVMMLGVASKYSQILQYGFVSATVALAQSGGVTQKTLHLMVPGGLVFREHFPTDATPYYDNINYVTSTWTCPVIHPPGDQGRFRLWDIDIFGQSKDPHGLVVSVGKDYAPPTAVSTFAWTDINGTTPLTQIRSYCGQMGEAFQVSIQDVADASSVTGQGFQVLGYTLGIGTYPGPNKLPSGQTK